MDCTPNDDDETRRQVKVETAQQVRELHKLIERERHALGCMRGLVRSEVRAVYVPQPLF